MATGRKTVVAGQVIDPVAWGNPLWDQSVQTFASAADRTSQFPAPKQGAVTWLEDLKVMQVFDGTTWQDVGPRPYGLYARTTDLSVPTGAVILNQAFTTKTERGFTEAAGVVTFARAGIYTVTFAGEFSNQIGGTRQGFVLLNSTDPAAAVVADKQAAQGAQTSGMSVAGSVTRAFAANDRLQLAFYHDGGPTLNILGASPFNLCIVGVA
jgi:hypothetical protein